MLASYLSSLDRRRVTAFLLALAIELLIAIALITLGVARSPRKIEPRLTTFDVTPAAKTAAARAPKQTVAKAAARASKAAPVIRPPKPPLAPPLKNPIPGLIVLNPTDFAASDIARIPSRSGEEEASAGAGKDSGSAYGPGEGPGGQPLYNAEWYREPSRAEMATYLPRLTESAYGLIACKTIENYHVENCRALGESPVGSGMARAMRLASWQFLVRPPRIGGKPQIGAWVRIRFDLTITTKEEAP